jgi:hypothetical protein
LAAEQCGSTGGSAMDQAMAAIDATFNEAGIVNSHKLRVERYIRLSFAHPETRARYAGHIRRFAEGNVSLDQACRILRMERMSPRRESIALPRMVRAELHLILRWLRAKRMHRGFAETIVALRHGADHQRELIAAE